jgi:hypothetical protein
MTLAEQEQRVRFLVRACWVSQRPLGFAWYSRARVNPAPSW